MGGSKPKSGIAVLAATRPWIHRSAKQVLHSVAQLLFPPACCNCQCEIESPDDILICDSCRQQLIDSRTSCAFCGAGIGAGSDPHRRCVHCRDDRFRFQTVIRLGAYESPLQRAIKSAKQVQHSALAIHLGRLFARVRHAELRSQQCDAIVAVPAHWKRQRLHGHNSAEVIGQQIAAELGVPLAQGVLLRSRATRPQTELSPRERRTNVRDAFSVRNHPDLRDAKLLLVDDVMTTGATANEVSRMLLAAGAASVAVAVLARAVGER